MTMPKDPIKRAEYIKKLSDGKKGDKNPAKRPDVRLKISKSQIGKKLSEEHKKKISGFFKSPQNPMKDPSIAKRNADARRGAKRTQESKNKMSAALKGKPAWNKGTTLSESHKQKLRDARSNGRFSKEKSPKWKGGVTPLHEQIRKCDKMKEWKAEVLARDNYTCVFTGQVGGKIEVHHSRATFTQLMKTYKIKSLEDALNCEALWCIDNGLTVSKSFHKELHTKKKVTL